MNFSHALQCEMSQFPPLTAKENYLLFRKYADSKESGDARGATEIRNQIIEGNLKIAVKIALKRSNKSNFDEVLSEAIMGLIKAVDYFASKPDFKCFSTFAYNSIWWSIATHSRRNAIRMNRFTSLGGDVFTVADQGPRHETDPHARCAIAEVISCLTDAERTILKMRYIDGDTAANIGRKLGVSRSSIYVSSRRIMERVRREVKRRCRGERPRAAVMRGNNHRSYTVFVPASRAGNGVCGERHLNRSGAA